MPLTKFPRGISSFGMPVLGGGSIPATTGTYYFVDSATGNNTNSGKDPNEAVASIDTAIGLCTASKGDIIIVMPGHAETTTGEITADVIGITILGLGFGRSRPTITANFG